jgi:hypothetical protein
MFGGLMWMNERMNENEMNQSRIWIEMQKSASRNIMEFRL